MNKEYSYKEAKEVEDTLIRYFRLEENLGKLKKHWGEVNDFFKRDDLPEGMRLIRQDPFECFVSFLTS